MAHNAWREELPAWALGAAIIAGLLILGFIGWWALARNPNAAGASKEVRPGMYDLRQEIQKSRARQPPAGSAGGF